MIRLLIIATILFSPLMGLDYPFDVAISGGWRDDRVTLKEELKQFKLERRSLDAKRLTVWEYGLKIRSTLSGLLFYQEGCWLENLYIRGTAFQGWIKGGRFTEGPFPLSSFSSDSSSSSSASSFSSSPISILASLPSSSISTSATSLPSSSSSSFSPFSSSSSSFSSETFDHRKIHHGRTLDADIAFGFAIPFSPNLNWGPVGGYAFNKQKIDIDHGHFSWEVTTKWKGPWAGVDFALDLCCVRMRAGYEYHWVEWEGFFRIHQHGRRCHRGKTLYSDKRQTYAAWGQVGFVELRYLITDGFDLGLSFSYKYFQARKGQIVSDGASLSSSSSSRLRIASSWRSFGVRTELVYRF